MTLSFTGSTVAVLVSPFFGIAVDDLPFLLAGLGVERDQGRVGLMEVDRAVRIGDAAVNRIATHHRNDGGILLGLVFPDDLALFIQIESVDDVGKGRVHIHDVADHEGRALMSTQHAG